MSTMSSESRLSYFKPWDAVFTLLLLGVHGAAWYAVSVLDMRGLLWFWVAYECLLLFTHLPFPFANTLYRAADWLYDNVNPTLYWGLETASAVFAFATVGAPFFVLLNALTHGLFLVKAYQHGAFRSSRFYSPPHKTPRINAIITFDNICHLTCLWFYLDFALRDATAATGVGLGLLAGVGLLTAWYHRGELRLGHFFNYLRLGLGPSPKA
jgi:hypothetical protein